MRIARIFTFMNLLFAVLSSCGHSHSSFTKAVDAESSYGQALAIMDDLLRDERDFIPYEIKQEGCQNRALFVAMELAAKQIPSSAVFIFTKPGGKLLRHRDASGIIEWSFHVA